MMEPSVLKAFLEKCISNMSYSYQLCYENGVAIVGSHFGDEGKGKIVDIMIRKYKAEGKKVINIRGQGGGNAGHTVIDAETGKEYHFHYLPSGGLVSDLILLGGGMLLDPIRICSEASVLPKEQQEKILIDGRATFCTLLERKMDGYHESKKSKKVGTTGSGVGPAVSYRALRVDIRFFEAKACKSWQELKDRFLRLPDIPTTIFDEIGKEYESFDCYVQELYDSIQKLNIVESMPIIQKTKDEGWALVLEVSQAFGLDIIFGNRGKYVTSTHTIVAGALSDAGLTPGDIPEGTVLIAKAYASKVGGGYFVTAFGNGDDETPEDVPNYIYEKNGEYGVTTGRKRNLGWFDCVAVRAAIQRNGSRKLAINCMDTIGMIPGNVAKICVAYKHIKKQTETVFWPDFQEEYEPVYIEIPTNWNIKHFTDETKLPNEVWRYLGCIAYYTGADICYIGTGGSNLDIIKFSEYGKQKIADVVNCIQNLYDMKSDLEGLTDSIENHIHVAEFLASQVEEHEWTDETFDTDADCDENDIDEVKEAVMQNDAEYDMATFDNFEKTN